MALYPVAGCRLYIGGQKADQNTDFVESDFSGETWVEVDGFSQLGAYGDNAALITTALINRSRDIKQKGTTNAGSMACVFAHIPTDLGQIAVFAAAQGAQKNNYSWRLDLNDQVGAGAPSKRYFVGLAMSAQEAGGGANTIRNLNVTIEINSNVVRVAAT